MPQARPHLLITDDDPDDVFVFGSEFTTQNPGIPVTHLAGGCELMRYLDGCPDDDLPRILLLDYKMPDLNGAQVLEMLNANQRYDRLVRVMWSTSRIHSEMISCVQLGAIDYFRKPGTNEELSQLARKVGLMLQSAYKDRNESDISD